MPRTLTCPSCNGALPHGAPGNTVTCTFCGTPVLVPGEPAPAPHPQMVTPPYQIHVSTYDASGGGWSWVGKVIGLVITLVVVAGVVVPVLLVTRTVEGVFSDAFEGIEQLPGGAVGEVADAGGDAGAVGEFVLAEPATPAITFGNEGTGVGQLDDARELGVDASGNVYVGEFGSGRIQRFTQAGEHTGQWTVVDDTHVLSAMTVARDGTVYVLQGVDVHRYDGLTGTHLGTVTLPSDAPVTLLTAAAPLPDGGVLVVEESDTLVWLTSEGAVAHRVEPEVLGGGSTIRRVAVDGQGRVFALGTRADRASLDDGVFVFDASGGFVNFFGGSGDEPGQFQAPQAIAVDGQSRVAVSVIFGVQLYDASGRYLERLRVDGAVGGVAFDEQDRLWVTNRASVMAFELG